MNFSWHVVQISDDIKDAIIYLDAGCTESFQFLGAFPLLLELGARAVCSLEKTSPLDEVRWLPFTSILFNRFWKFGCIFLLNLTGSCDCSHLLHWFVFCPSFAFLYSKSFAQFCGSYYLVFIFRSFIWESLHVLRHGVLFCNSCFRYYFA